MKVKTYFLRSLLLLALLVPWITQGQVAKVSEYDASVTTAAYGSIVGTSGATAWGQTSGHVDVSMNFAMPFGEQTIAQSSTLRVYGDGHAEFVDLPGSMLAPLYYAGGYTTTATSVYTKSIGSTGMVVEWRKVTANNNSLSFQLMLYSSGDIEFHYGPMTINEGVQVFAGLKSSANDVFSTRGEVSLNDWGTLGRNTIYAIRTLSSASRPAFNSNQGVVYTFTQPACVKPTSATATATAWDAIHVTWEVSRPGTKYEVRYSDILDFNPDQAGTSLMVTQSDANSADITGLHGNTTYQVYVRSYCDGSISSGWKEAGSVTTPNSCPSIANSKFSLTPAGQASWDLTNNPNVTSIDIYYSTANEAPDAETAPSMTVQATTSQVDLAAVPAIAATSNTTWYVWFRGNCTVDGGTTLDWTSSARSFTTPCMAINVTKANPFQEGFESGVVPPDCWRKTILAAPGTTSPNWQSSTSYAHSGSYSAQSKDASSGSSVVMSTPQLVIPANYQLKFWTYRNTTSSSYQEEGIRVWTNSVSDATEGGTQIAYAHRNRTIADENTATPTLSADGWCEYVVPLSAGTYYVLFEGYQQYGSSNYMDDITIEKIPTCSNPTDIAGNNPITWTAGTATQWQVRWAEQGSTDYTSAIVTEPTYTSSAWVSNTDYTIQIRSICGEGDTNDWVSYDFTTPCPIFAVTLGNSFFEGFEYGYSDQDPVANCWSQQSVSGTSVWSVNSPATTNYNRSARTGSYSASLKYSNTRWLFYRFHLTAGTSYDFSMFARQDGSTTSNANVTVMYGAEPTTAGMTNSIVAVTGLNNTYQEIAGSFVPETTGDYYIGIKGYINNSPWYITIDDISVAVSPTCFKPTDVAATPTTSSAELSWTENGTATQWEVRYWKTGAEADAISVFPNANPYTLNYLDMATSYSFQVRGICSVGDTAEWSDVSSFNTVPCVAYGELGEEEEHTIGEGGNSNGYLPGHSLYDYFVSQQIYTADEIGGAGTINSIAIEITGVKERNVKIYLAETAKTNFSSGSDWVSVTEDNLVFTGSIGATLGWQTITLDDSFAYSGSNSLVLVINKVGDANWSSGLGARASSGHTNQSLYAYRDKTPYDLSNLPSGTMVSDRNNIKLGIQYRECLTGTCPPPAVAIAPSNDVRGQVTLTFTAPDENTTDFGYKVGLQGFDPTTAAESGVASADNNQIVLSLQQQTTYDLYVYSRCTGVDNPRMVRYSFTTPFVPDCKVPNTFDTSNVSYTSATISWHQADPPPAKWVLQYGTDATFAENTQVDVTDNPSHTLTDLEPATTYYVRAKSVCTEDVDESPWSTTRESVFSFTTLTCQTPSNVVATDVTNSTARISWTENGNANAWTIKYGPQGFDPETEGTAVTSDDETSVELTGLDAYAYYDVYVKSNCTSTVESEWSDACTFRTACPEQLETTVDGTETYTMVSGTNPDLHLTQHGAIIYDDGGPDGDYSSSANQTLVIYPATEGNSVHLQGEYSTEGNTYDYAIIYNGVGTSGSQLGEMRGQDGTLDVTSTDATGALTIWFKSDGSVQKWGFALNATEIAPCNTDATCFAPASVSTSVAPTNEVTVSWTHRTDLRPIVTNFELRYGERGFDPETSGMVVSNLNDTHSYVIASGLAAEKDYDVYVRTVCGPDDHSSWTKASFHTYPSCWAPVNVRVNHDLTTDTTVTLSWENDTLAPSEATRWEVAYGPKGFGNPDFYGTHITTTNHEAFVINGLKHSTLYEFFVRAVCSADDHSAWTEAVTEGTGCAVWQYEDMPLVENFDGYTAPTSTSISSSNHPMPNCWSVINGGSSSGYYPSIYSNTSYAHSGTNSLYFYRYNSTSSSYKDQYAVLPQFGFKLDTLEISFYASFGNTYSAIEVGVMTDPDDAATFVPVDTVKAPSTGQLYEVSLGEYEGEARYVAFKAGKPNGGSYNYNTVYLDDLTVKLRESVNTLPDNGGEFEVCNEFVMPVTAANNGNYHANLNATYTIRPAQPGYVAHISGTYDLEEGYDYLTLYRGAANANNLVGRYTGTGEIDYKTNSNLWQDSGFVTLVFTTDGENALTNTGFKLLVNCEQPNASNDTIPDVVEENGTYTWAAGNGTTYENISHLEAANDLTVDVTIPKQNVAGFDSVYRHLSLILHPVYEIISNVNICEGESYDFYGNTYSATGSDTVRLQSQYGADSTGILNLQVNSVPLAYIYSNNQEVQTIDAACDSLPLLLEARSDATNAIFRWENDSTGASRVVYPHIADSFSVVATNPATRCSSEPVSVIVNTIPVPALSVSGDEEVCFGQSATLTVTDANALDARYVWRKKGTTASLGTGDTLTVTPSETTTYTVTATTNNASACAVTAEYTVTVNPLPVITTPSLSVPELCLNKSVTISAEVKEGYNYAWNTGDTTAVITVVPAATGVFTVTVTDQKGCSDEFATPSLTVYPSYEISDSISACVRMLPYSWGGQQLSDPGEYAHTFKTAHDCDSLVHLTFELRDTANYNTYRELCEGTPFTFGEGQYEQQYTATASTVITYVDTTSGECPARYNLYLTVNTHNPASVDLTVCDSYTWPLTGLTYLVSGVYQDTLLTTKGCDSTVTLNLTVNHQNTGVEYVEFACDGYEWHDSVYTEPTSEPTFTLKNQYDCDSVVTLNLLAVNHSSTGIDNIIYCASTEYTWINGRTYRLSETSGTAAYTLPGVPNAQGCDSIVVLNLTMNYVRDTLNWKDTVACDEFAIDTVACDNTVTTAYIRESGDYQFRVHGNNGSDVIARYHLVVKKSHDHTNPVTACLPYTWYVGEREIATITADMVNGNPRFIMSVDMSENGSPVVDTTCSNIEVLYLTPLYPTYDTTDTVTICQGQSWTATNDKVFTTSGVHIWDATSKNADGCPLYQQVDLTVNPVYDTAINLVLCESQFVKDTLTNEYTYTYHAENDTDSVVLLTIPGALSGEVYEDSVKNIQWKTVAGCDSVLAIYYTVNPTLRDTVEQTACYKFLWNGVAYDHDTTVSVLDTSAQYGCDSITTLVLTINDTLRTYIDSNVCTKFEYNGVEYFESMTVLDKELEAESRCDSLVYINFIVHQPTLTEQFVYTNEPYTWVDSNTYTKSVSEAYYNINNGGCDSTLLLHLTMSEPIVLCEGQLPYTVRVGNDSLFVIGDPSTDTFSYCGNSVTYGWLGQGGPGPFSWGIRLPSLTPTTNYTLQGAQLFFVNTDDNTPGTYVMNIYTGGESAPETLVGTKSLTFTETDATGWKEFVLDTPVSVDNQIVWITFSTNAVEYPAAFNPNMSNSTADPFWVGLNGTNWVDARLYDFGYPAMIKAVYSSNEWRTSNEWRNNDPQGNDTIIAYTVNANVTKDIEAFACDSYEWHDSVYTASTDSAHFDTVNVNGCDSTTVLHLTVGTTVNDTITACDSYTWRINDSTYTQSTDVTYRTAGATSCDSILHLTVKNSVVKDSVTLVNAASTIYRGVLYTAPFDGTINDTVVRDAANGCDSITRMRLRVNLGDIITEEVVYCGDYTWRDGNTYTWIPMAERPNPVINYKNLTTGQYVFEFPVYDSIDENGIVLSTYVLHLTLQEARTEYKDVTVLLSNNSYTDTTNSHTFDFTTVKESGRDTTVYDTLRLGGSGTYCDSIVYYTFHLIYNYATVNDTICGEDTTYVFNGHTYPLTASGASGSGAINTIFSCGFEALEDTAGWIFVDADGDGYNWMMSIGDGLKVQSGVGVIYSQSYDNHRGVLHPDNWMILPAITLPNAPDSLNWFDIGQDEGWCDENYSVYISTTGNATTDFTTVLYNGVSGGSYVKRNVDLSAYAGQTVYIAFRHHDVSDLFYLNIDDISITSTSSQVSDYTFTENVGTGNDMVVTTMNVHQLPLVTGTDTLVGCDSVSWNNRIFTETQVVDVPLTAAAANGCDSVVTLHITVTPTIHEVTIDTACDSYVWNGRTYTASTVDTFAYANTTDPQCVNVDTLKLTINNSTVGTDVQTACDSYEWIDGNTYTTSDTASFTLANANAAGCDSVVTLNLTVNHSFTGAGRDIDTLATSITLTDKNGTHFYPAGTDEDITLVYQTVAGCDSTVTFHLKVSQYQIIADNQVACGVFYWNQNNHYYKWISNEEKTEHTVPVPGVSPMVPLYKDITSGNYVYSNPTDTVADLVHMLNLFLDEAQFVDSSIAFYPQSMSPLTLHGNAFDLSGLTSATRKTADTVVYLTLPHATLCGTVMAYNVHVGYNYSTDTQTVCYDSVYTWEDGDTTHVKVGTNARIVKTLFEGDTLNEWVVTRTINVRANNNLASETKTVCDSIRWNDSTYTVSTSGATYTTKDQFGCDSTITLNLTVKYNSNKGVADTACDSYTWHDTTYTASGNYLYKYTAENDCPSVDTLHLTINVNNSGVNDTVSACNDYYWAISERTYTTDTTIVFKTADTNGCYTDNKLTLTVNHTVSRDLYVTDGSYSYVEQNGTAHMILNGHAQSFIERYPYPAVADRCDSIFEITIHVGEGYFAVDDTTVCNSFTWRDDNTYVWISAEERAAHNNALFKNQTTGDYVLSNPIWRVANEGTFDSIFMLRLNLTQNFAKDVYIDFPISLDSLVYDDSTFYFTMSEDSARVFVNTTVDKEVHYHSDYYCDSVHYLHITLRNNYTHFADTNICVTQSSFSWRGHTINTTATDYDKVGTFYAYDTVSTVNPPVVEYIKITQHPVVYATERRTACDSYTWNDSTYTVSTSNAIYTTTNQFGCDSTVILLLTIKNSTDSVETATACGSYEWSGRTFTESIDDTTRNLINSVGCDSTAILHLTVNPVYNIVAFDTVCDSYTWNGELLTKTDIYEDTLKSVNGCDSVVTLNLMVNYNTGHDVTVTACDSYTWHDTIPYTVSDDYYYEYTAANGCASIDTLHLTVKYSSHEAIIETVCDYYTWHDSLTYTESGDYEFHYTNADGCASTDTLHLTIKQSSHVVTTDTACNSYTWSRNNESYDETGKYVYNYTAENGCASADTLNLTLFHGTHYAHVDTSHCGPFTWVVNGDTVFTYSSDIETSTQFVSPVTKCDSVVYLRLTVRDTYATYVADSLCATELPYVWNVDDDTLLITESGDFSFMYTAENGCDSSSYMSFYVIPTLDSVLNVQVCLGKGYNDNGFVIEADSLPEPGIYTFSNTLTSSLGCDSIVTLNITVGKLLSFVEEQTVCDSYTWDKDDQNRVFTESGTYWNSPYMNEGGCMSIDTLKLIVNHNSNTGYVVSACVSYEWHDSTYTEPGDYEYDYTTEEGCASTDTLHLSIKVPTNQGYTVEACDSYLWNGQTFTEPGDFIFDYTSTTGCPSVDTLHLTLKHSSNSAVIVTACDSLSWNGNTYTASDDYTYTTTNAAGCDSVVTLHLTINHSTSGIDVQSACDSYTWRNGEVYTASTITPTFTLQNAAGCDSVITLHLTVNHSTTATETQSACDSYTWNGQTYTTSGNYTYSTTNAAGCDSTATLILTINHSVQTSETVVANGPYTWNGTVYTDPGTYTYNGTTAAGCDSIATLYLSFTSSTSFAIIAVANDNALGTVTGGGNYDAGTSVTLTATPAANARFVNWNDGDTNASRVITVTGNASYIANFAYLPANVTLVVNDATMGSTNPAPGSYAYEVGTTVVAQALPADGFQFSNWSVSINGEPSTVATNPISVTIPAAYAGASVVVSANFVPDTFDVIVRANSEVMGSVSGSGRYLYGDIATITATPNSGYEFLGWNDGDTNATRSVTVTSDVTYTAMFGLDMDATLTVSVNNDEWGYVLINGERADSYVGQIGDEVTIEAHANEGYRFVNWDDHSTNFSRTIVLSENVMSMMAIFEENIGINEVKDEPVVIFSEGNRIIVRGAEYRTVRVFDVVGRLFAKRTASGVEEVFCMPNTGVYLIKVDNAPVQRVVVRP